MSGLTPRERQFLDLLKRTIQQNGYPPSIRMMRDAMNYRSNSPVQNALKSLEKKGYIYREKGKARTLRILEPMEPVGVFLRGTIAAGGVVESFTESFTDSALEPIQVPAKLNKPGNYALQVIGDSMIGAHICSGDLVILAPVREAQALKPGSIVAARVEGQGTTLKHFYLQQGRVRLQPANPNFPMIEEDAALVQIQGVLVGVWREY